MSLETTLQSLFAGVNSYQFKRPVTIAGYETLEGMVDALTDENRLDDAGTLITRGYTVNLVKAEVDAQNMELAVGDRVTLDINLPTVDDALVIKKIEISADRAVVSLLLGDNT